MNNADDSMPTLPYATPAPPAGPGVAAGVWITLAGLALIFLGGCFCIGVLLDLGAGFTSGPNPPPPPAPNTGFIALMYALAIACFAAAALLLVLGIRKLLHVGRY